MGSRTADITKFIENGEIEGHAVVIDSSDRDRLRWPLPSEFRTNFDDPYYNVVSVEVLDAFVPKMDKTYEIETITVHLIHTDNTSTNECDIEYTGISATTLVTASFNKLTVTDNVTPVTINITNDKLKKKFTFKSSNNVEFSIDGSKMSNTSLDRLGLQKRVYVSTNGVITADFQYNFSPDIYINVSCDEIDTMVNRGKMNKQTMSFGRITLGSDDTTTSINQDFDNMSFPPRYFHPMAKLSALTLRFKKKNGELYNFQGLNHVITLIIRCIVIKDHILPQSHNSTTIAENVTKHIENTKKIKDIKREKKNKIVTKEKKQVSDSYVYGALAVLSIGTFLASYS